MEEINLTKEEWEKIDEYLPEDGTDWDGVSIPTRRKILQLIEKSEKLERKFQLLLKYADRDFVSTIKYILELKEENNKLKEPIILDINNIKL